MDKANNRVSKHVSVGLAKNALQTSFDLSDKEDFNDKAYGIVMGVGVEALQDLEYFEFADIEGRNTGLLLRCNIPNYYPGIIINPSHLYSLLRGIETPKEEVEYFFARTATSNNKDALEAMFNYWERFIQERFSKSFKELYPK